MSYTTLLTGINTQMDAAGLAPAAEQRDSSLLQAGRGNFDGSYLLINKTGAQPWPELAVSPSHWWARLVIEVGTELKGSYETQSIMVESRARAVFENLVYPGAAVAQCLYEWSEPRIERATQSKRLVWTIEFKARWSE